MFTNGGGSATSDPATLTVPAPTAPTVTTQPINQSSYPGGPSPSWRRPVATPTPTVEWQVSTDGGATWTVNGNSTSDDLTGPVFGTFENGWEVRAVFTNEAGSATTDPATLTVS